jgi:hypothetical protein
MSGRQCATPQTPADLDEHSALLYLRNPFVDNSDCPA